MFARKRAFYKYTGLEEYVVMSAVAEILSVKFVFYEICFASDILLV